MNFIVRHFLNFVSYRVHLEPQVLEQFISEERGGCGHQDTP